ncbi:unnamed protein product [Fraxinus pennsylvanica]|uniref:Uncharacterized protein n=1 Tax=Fraxinus pennsylvanica TaxID=56036 RepID=A0AAD1Z1I4_9LAMI|nr:unnamed protein product [Fraxinus pennsylvanica]
MDSPQIWLWIFFCRTFVVAARTRLEVSDLLFTSSKAMKKWSTLKLLLELYFVGVVEDSSIFTNIIKDLTGTEHFKDRDATQTNLSLLASFARQGRYLLGLPLTGQDMLEECIKYHSM